MIEPGIHDITIGRTEFKYSYDLANNKLVVCVDYDIVVDSHGDCGRLRLQNINMLAIKRALSDFWKLVKILVDEFSVGVIYLFRNKQAEIAVPQLFELGFVVVADQRSHGWIELNMVSNEFDYRSNEMTPEDFYS